MIGLRRAGTRVGDWLVGPLAHETRHNMWVELVGALAMGVFWVALLFVPVILRRLSAPAEAIAFFSASSYLGYTVSPFGLLLLQPGRVKRTLVICWLISRGVFFCAVFAYTPAALLGLVAVYWLADGIVAPLYSTVLKSIYPVESRGRIMGVIRLSMSIVMLVGSPIAGWVLDHAGHRVLLPVAGVFGLIYALSYTRLRFSEEALVTQPQPVAQAPTRGDTWRHLWAIIAHDRNFAVWLAGVVVFGLSSLMPLAFFPLVQVDRLHLSYTQLGWLGLAQSVARLLSYLYWGKILDRWGVVRCMQGIFVVNIIVAAPYIWATQGWMLIPSFIGIGLVNAGLELTYLNGPIQLARAGRTAEYAAVQATIQGLRGLISPFVGVGLVNAGLGQPALFILCAVLTLIAAAMLQGVRVPAQERQPNGLT